MTSELNVPLNMQPSCKGKFCYITAYRTTWRQGDVIMKMLQHTKVVNCNTVYMVVKQHQHINSGKKFLTNVNLRTRSVYAISRPSVICNVRAPYCGDQKFLVKRENFSAMFVYDMVPWRCIVIQMKFYVHCRNDLIFTVLITAAVSSFVDYNVNNSSQRPQRLPRRINGRWMLPASTLLGLD